MRSVVMLSALVLLAVIVSGGILVAFVNLSSSASPAYPSTPGVQLVSPQQAATSSSVQPFPIGGIGTSTVTSISSATRAALTETATATVTAPGAIATVTSASGALATSRPPAPTTNVITPNLASGQAPPAQEAPQTASTSLAGRSIEYVSNLTLRVPSVPTAFANATSIAYDLGGYVALSTQSNSTSLVVIRVPASTYQDALNRVEALGTLVNARSSSNDVTVKYTDLNATLESLQTEQASLLKILAQSTNTDATLNVESDLQGVDQQIDQTQSQILQTETLIAFSTISVQLEGRAAVASPLSLKLTATPLSGISPLSVTFRAVAKGGSAPYFVNYNFGDGSSSQGQALIHEFAQPGRYNVTVTATDSSANVAEAWTIVEVAPPSVGSGIGNFPAVVGSLFLHVVEGIVEVAVVVLPLALVALAVVFPLRHRLSSHRKKEP